MYDTDITPEEFNRYLWKELQRTPEELQEWIEEAKRELGEWAELMELRLTTSEDSERCRMDNPYMTPEEFDRYLLRALLRTPEERRQWAEEAKRKLKEKLSQRTERRKTS